MRLRYTLPALADLESILDYVADRSPQGAARIHSRIRAITRRRSRCGRVVMMRIGSSSSWPLR